MSYPDPHRSQQQPLPAPPPLPGPHGYGYPPNGGYRPTQPYGAQLPHPYYPPPDTTKPAGKPDKGNSWGWQLLEGLLVVVSGSSSHDLGKTSRDRVKAALMIIGITFLVIVGVILVVAIVSMK